MGRVASGDMLNREAGLRWMAAAPFAAGGITPVWGNVALFGGSAPES